MIQFIHFYEQMCKSQELNNYSWQHMSKKKMFISKFNFCIQQHRGSMVLDAPPPLISGVFKMKIFWIALKFSKHIFITIIAIGTEWDAMAQMAERLFRISEVRSSNPTFAGSYEFFIKRNPYLMVTSYIVGCWEVDS